MRALSRDTITALESGVVDGRGVAMEEASDALVRAVTDRGGTAYRLTVADTEAIIVPGLTGTAASTSKFCVTRWCR